MLPVIGRVTPNPGDNAAVEDFFKALKVDLPWHVKFKSREQAEKATHDYIMNFYNRKRR